MALPKRYDVVVIGSGSAGLSAVESARSLGARVALVEKERLGGECPNWGCVPSKALLRSARIMRDSAQAERFGIRVGQPVPSWNAIRAWRDQAVSRITGGEQGERYHRLLQSLHVDVYEGSAQFVEPTVLQVGDQLLSTKSVVIATGTTEFIPQIKGLDEVPFFTSRTVFDRLEDIPKSLCIIGGGPVGCEFATFFASLGTRVSIVQSGPSLLGREDQDVSAYVREQFVAAGMEVYTDASVDELVNGRGVYGVRITAEGKEHTLPCTAIMFATGKRAATEGLGLTDIGVALDARGYIKTDSMGRTSVPSIYAAGDCDGGYQFTHTATHEGVVSGTNAAAVALGKRTRMKRDESVVPRVTFTEPEVASVGMTHAEALAKHKRVGVGKVSLAGFGRAVTDGVDVGFVKVVTHPKTGVILGAHVVGPHAGEVIHEAALACACAIAASRFLNVIHAYPTYSEALYAAVASIQITSS